MAGFDKGMMYHSYFIKDLMEPEKVSMKSGYRFTERGVEIYDTAKGEWEPIASAYKWVSKRTRPAKPNNKTMKYRTIAHFHNIPKGVEIGADSGVYAHNIIYDIHNDKWKANPSFLKNNDHLFEPVEEVKAGDWIIGGSGTPLYVNNKVLDEYYSYTKYRDNADPITDGRLEKKNFERKATTDEIRQALTKEAKRRGYTRDNFVDMDHPNWTPTKKNCNQYIRQDDALLWYNKTVYKEGQWAKIVDQTPTIEINGHEAEFHEDYVQFGCAKISKRIFQELHYANNQCGGELFRTGFGGNRAVQGIKIGDGIFGTDQINEIAEYYE